MNIVEGIQYIINSSNCIGVTLVVVENWTGTDLY